jgi:hypothetical protein
VETYNPDPQVRAGLDTLPGWLAERAAHPYAVQYRLAGAVHPTITAFAVKREAAAHAEMLRGPGNEVRLFVAVADRSVVFSTELGWREVSEFVL